MKKTLIIAASLVALLIMVVQAGQRIRLIDVDSATTPAATSVATVALTAATNTAGSATFKAAATQAQLTLYTMVITNAHADVTNVVTVVTNVTIDTVWGFATTTAQVVETNSSAGFGFTEVQANSVLTNAYLFQQLLQSY